MPNTGTTHQGDGRGGEDLTSAVHSLCTGVTNGATHISDFTSHLGEGNKRKKRSSLCVYVASEPERECVCVCVRAHVCACISVRLSVHACVCVSI